MTAADQLLDPTFYASTRLGVMESDSLPASVYTSGGHCQRKKRKATKIIDPYS